MDISILALKQKRLKDWSEFVEREVQDLAVQTRMRKTLRDYSALIFACFQRNSVDQDDILLFEDLERMLQELTEQGRLRVTPKSSHSA